MNSPVPSPTSLRDQAAPVVPELTDAAISYIENEDVEFLQIENHRLHAEAAAKDEALLLAVRRGEEDQARIEAADSHIGTLKHKLLLAEADAHLQREAARTANTEIKTIQSKSSEISRRLRRTQTQLTEATLTAQANSINSIHPPNNVVTRKEAIKEVKAIFHTLNRKTAGSNKGTKLIAKALTNIALAYDRLDDVPKETLTAYKGHLQQFPQSHLKAINAERDIVHAISSTHSKAGHPGNPFVSIIIDQLKRLQAKSEMFERDTRTMANSLREERATSTRLRGTRNRLDTKVDLLRQEITTTKAKLISLSQSDQEVIQLRAANRGLTAVITSLHDDGMQTPNAARPSQHDLRYMRSMAAICANPDIVLWKWTLIMQGLQNQFYEFLSTAAARTILQRSDQSAAALPTGSTELRLTKNAAPVDLLFCSYATTPTQRRNDFIKLHNEALTAAVVGDTALGICPSLFPKQTNATIAGVMLGVTLRSLTTKFRQDHRSPFVRVFGKTDSFAYVLTGDTFIPLRQLVNLRDLQPGYSHKAQSGSYIPSLALTDNAYSALHGYFMSWTSTAMHNTGPPHPLLTGPAECVMVSVKRHTDNAKKIALNTSKKRPRPA